jgi:hypothetical protein
MRNLDSSEIITLFMKRLERGISRKLQLKYCWSVAFRNNRRCSQQAETSRNDAPQASNGIGERGAFRQQWNDPLRFSNMCSLQTTNMQAITLTRMEIYEWNRLDDLEIPLCD